jgi:outer membrane protein assembly factor BamB
MGRRRALAALAGMASAGLVVAGWELTRPGPAAAGKLTAADQAAQGKAKSARPGTLLWSAETNAAVNSVTVGGGVVYAGTAKRAVYAFDALTGRPLWHHLSPATRKSSAASGCGPGSGRAAWAGSISATPRPAGPWP